MPCVEDRPEGARPARRGQGGQHRPRGRGGGGGVLSRGGLRLATLRDGPLATELCRFVLRTLRPHYITVLSPLELTPFYVDIERSQS